MKRNAAADLLQFIIGGSLACAGGFLLVWASLAALSVGVLNSIRLTFMPTTLWALAVYIVMISAGGGLMFRSLGGYENSQPNKQ